jgi:TatD DNase family protein
VPWFDSHCHVQDRYLERRADPADGSVDEGPAGDGPSGSGSGAFEEMLEACWAEGVARLVCIGTDPESSEQALSLARRSQEGALGAAAPEIWATAGLHPHDAASGGSPGAGDGPGAPTGTGRGVEAIRRIVDRELAAAGRPAPGHSRGPLVAVGECGLDYHYDHSPRDVQRRVFAEHVQLAHEYGLALVIHAREAWPDLFDVLVGEGVPARSVVHCFTGGPEEARAILDLGMWISFSGIVTFKKAEDVREAAALCPLDRLLVETDSPFLAPVPHRGRTNEPAFVPLVGAAVAAAKELDPEEVAQASWRNASEVFGL